MKILSNKYVLYGLVFLTVTNVIGMVATDNFDSVLMMGMVGYLTTYFSKNMIVVLATALLVTHVVFSGSKMMEGMKGSKGKKGKKEKKSKKENFDDATEEEEEPTKNDMLERAYDNLDRLKNGQGVKNVDPEQIKKLTETLDTLRPAIKQATGMINMLSEGGSKLGNLMETLKGYQNKLGK